MREALRRTGVPGLSVAVVHGDQVVDVKGFGVREAGKPEPVDADTVFQLASMSKPIASTVVAALVGDGMVDWDDPIVSHDPGFRDARRLGDARGHAARHVLPPQRPAAITPATCRGHRLRPRRGAAPPALRQARPASFRSHYAYTNFGLTAAAVAAAKASGKSWEELSAERLYRPLGMTQHELALRGLRGGAEPRRRPRPAGRRNWIAKYTRDPDAQSPAGGVSSSARDLAQWLRLQLGRGTLDGSEIVKAAALDETHRPQIVDHAGREPDGRPTVFYGLGWNVSYDEQGRIRWSHSGALQSRRRDLRGRAADRADRHRRADQRDPDRRTGGGGPELPRSGADRQSRTGLVRACSAQAMAQIMAPDYGTSVDYSKPPPQPALRSQPRPMSAAIATISTGRRDRRERRRPAC